MAELSQWAHTNFKCQILHLCRNQISAKSSRLVSVLNWFVLQRTVHMLTHYTRSWMFGVWVGDRTSKDPLQISKDQITKCPFRLSFTALFIHAQGSSAHSITLVLCLLIFNLCCCLGTRALLISCGLVIPCSRLHPLNQSINGTPTSCSSFYLTLWEGTGKKYMLLSLPLRS